MRIHLAKDNPLPKLTLPLPFRPALVLATLIIAAQVLVLPEAVAQGTLYLSNLGQASGGSVAVGSDAWVAQGFYTGTNLASPYTLGSVQLRVDHLSGSPVGLKVSIYGEGANTVFPGSPMGSLSGADPLTGGVFTYTASEITLQPSAHYFLVVSSATASLGGAYHLTFVTNVYVYTSVEGWSPGGPVASNDGLTWVRSGEQLFQFAIEATVIPEPSCLGLAGCGVLLLAVLRRTRK